MARFPDLPVEIIIEILLTMGLTSTSSKNMIALANTSKIFHACFKEHERHIFLSIVKALIPEGEGMLTMVLNLGTLHVVPPEYRPKDNNTIKNLVEGTYHSPNFDTLKPFMFPEILAWLHGYGALDREHITTGQEQFSPFYTPPSSPWVIQHPFDVLWPPYLARLDPEWRAAALYSHVRSETQKFFQHRRESDLSQTQITEGDLTLQDRTILGRLHGRPICRIQGCDHAEDRCKTYTSQWPEPQPTGPLTLGQDWRGQDPLFTSYFTFPRLPPRDWYQPGQ